MKYEWNVPNRDIDDYISACKSFVENDEQFENFRQNSQYNVILEHVSKEESDILISEMKNKDSLSEELIAKIKENDLFGNPTKYDYDFFGEISPTTIRYIKNTLDIIDFFGNSEIKNIVEIGGGYGGLCRTLSNFFDFDNYLLIDLPEVNALSGKYLSKFESIKNKIIHLSYNEIDIVEGIDLLIANYSFSECSYEIQEEYYNKVIKNSEKFYMIYNNITPYNMNSDEYIKYASSDFDIMIEKEERKTNTNYILYGTKK